MRKVKVNIAAFGCLVLTSASALADTTQFTLYKLWWQGSTVLMDDGNPYPFYQWTASPPASYPITYPRSSTPMVYVFFANSNTNWSGDYWVRGSGNYGVNFAPQQRWMPLGSTNGTVGMNSSPFPNSVQTPSLNVNWESSLDGTNWSVLGTTANTTFVTLNAPQPAGSAPLYNRVLQVACAQAGATNDDGAFLNSWGQFLNLNSIPGLYYYRPGTRFSQNTATTVVQLFAAGTGECGAWQDFLYDCCLVHGIDSSKFAMKYVRPTSANDTGFFISNWTQSNGGSGPDPYRFQMWTYATDNSFEMVPSLPPGNDLSSTTGIPGQGSSSSNPSEKVFSVHKVLMYKFLGGSTYYYDPSYGKIYANANDMEQSAVYGFVKNPMLIFGPPLNQTQAWVRLATTSGDLTFSDY